jgi:hypothetical protein
MNHLPWMLERGATTGISEPCGHALMASCPPEPFSDLSPDIPFGVHHHNPNHHHNHNTATATASNGSSTGQGQVPAGGSTWTLSKGDLATLLDLSKRLNLDGEITPVMAWGMVLAHPRLGEMRQEDFGRLAEELGGKVRCYGYVVFFLFFFPFLGWFVGWRGEAGSGCLVACLFSGRLHWIMRVWLLTVTAGLVPSWRSSRSGMRWRASFP